MNNPSITLYYILPSPPSRAVYQLLLESQSNDSNNNNTGISFTTKHLNFMAGEHKSAEYLLINPNGLIPAIIDHTNKSLILYESSAILLYLVKQYQLNDWYPITDPRTAASIDSYLFWHQESIFRLSRNIFPNQLDIDNSKKNLKKNFQIILNNYLTGNSSLYLFNCKHPTIADLQLYQELVNLIQCNLLDNFQTEFPLLYRYYINMNNRIVSKKINEEFINYSKSIGLIK